MLQIKITRPGSKASCALHVLRLDQQMMAFALSINTEHCCLKQISHAHNEVTFDPEIETTGVKQLCMGKV